MNWLFWILLIFGALSALRGAQKGFMKTAVSMFAMIFVLAVVSWVNPYVGDFLREGTPVYGIVENKCDKIIVDYINDIGIYPEEREEIPLEMQISVIEHIPLPNSVKQVLLENNNSEIYQTFEIEYFVEYLSAYLSYCITNGIGFIVSFVIAIVLIKMILYAIDLLTEIPGVSFCNVVAGMALGLMQAILWIWVLFLIITVIYQSQIGMILVRQINESDILSLLYENNLLLNVILAVAWG